MAELKRCPFCDGEARIISESPNVEENGHFSEEYGVVCRSCGVNIGKTFHGEFFRENGEFYVVKDGYADAVAAWNRREGGA